MKIVILAATGGIGRELLDQAFAAGHEVTAVVRNPDRLSRPVRAVRADLAAADPGALESAVAGADAVLSGLGARSSAEAGVAWRGTRAISSAMTATGVRRIVVVSAAPIGTVASPGRPNPPRRDPGDGFLMAGSAPRSSGRRCASTTPTWPGWRTCCAPATLDWTVVRPPRLTDKPLTADYRTAYDRNIRGGAFASRADVAHLMLRVLGEPESVGRTVGIAN